MMLDRLHGLCSVRVLLNEKVLFGFYLCVLLFGFGIAEIAQRGIKPVKGLVAFGLVFISLLSVAGGILLKKENS